MQSQTATEHRHRLKAEISEQALLAPHDEPDDFGGNLLIRSEHSFRKQLAGELRHVAQGLAADAGEDFRRDRTVGKLPGEKIAEWWEGFRGGNSCSRYSRGQRPGLAEKFFPALSVAGISSGS